MFLKRYYCIKQHDITDCGAACLATVTKQYGKKKSFASIREIAGTSGEGTTAYGLVQAAREIGFDAKGVKGTIDQLMGENLLFCFILSIYSKHEFSKNDLPFSFLAKLKTDFFI